MHSLTVIYVMTTVATVGVLGLLLVFCGAVASCLTDEDDDYDECSSGYPELGTPPDRATDESLRVDDRSLQVTFLSGSGGQPYTVKVDVSPVEINFRDTGSTIVRLSNRWDAGWSDRIVKLTSNWVESHQVLYRGQDVYVVARERFVVYDDQDLDSLIYCGRAVRVKTVVLSS